MIRAVLTKPGAPGNLVLDSVDDPVPAPDMALVQVEAISLNQGEVRRAQESKPGSRIGWDLAGTVLRAAADGSGPRAGARVVGILETAAWAEQVAVPSRSLAVIPPEVSTTDAATLPVAGLTALHAIEKATGLLGRNVLVTGASGGVGLFACQLAKLSGARAVGLIRQSKHEPLLREFGVEHIVTGEDARGAEALGPYRLILESVGGPVLAQAIDLLGQDGVCVVFGFSSRTETRLSARQLFANRLSQRIQGLTVFQELNHEPASIGLSRLLALLVQKRLRPHIGATASWEEIGAIARDLVARKIPGKAVLVVRAT